ncbi:mitochondrial intermembrane space translocase subunit [Grosmannia clavigera kw1407]|uniref:Mitochondrial import inner membrane translocase subunit n=1 Tax=Grosmannia clavigera (strain kw1407 / UAMH 11150) TaxID=655863 RepID=F0XU69_GROCL|nr:mitochondrial intermembrane space translocase subunit [Grosmannia clavigera kw1407]EFW98559.1 mitochondrial intermembrane space translocase subunit [Grosmannia clavigera kw1407]
MSFFGIGRPQPTSAEKIAAVEAEMKMMADMHNRLVKNCTAKCVPGEYREGELNKGESVCLDRCAAKFFSVHMTISEQMQKEAQQRAGGAAPGGAGFGFGA